MLGKQNIFIMNFNKEVCVFSETLKLIYLVYLPVIAFLMILI